MLDGFGSTIGSLRSETERVRAQERRGFPSGASGRKTAWRHGWVVERQGKREEKEEKLLRVVGAYR
jgi:hypothetical protein